MRRARQIIAGVLIAATSLWLPPSAAAQESGQAGGEEAASADRRALDSRLKAGPGASAAEAFAADDPGEAARRYRVLLRTRGESADLLYNLGTAWAHADDPGRAIWALERARILAPRDEAIGHNLEVMRQRMRIQRVENRSGQKLTEGDLEGMFWFRLLTSLTPGEIAWLVVVFDILGFGLLAIWRVKRPGGVRDALAVAAAATLLLFTLSLGAGIGQAVVLDQIQIGVVLDDKVELHKTPTSTARHKPHPDIYPGARVRVLERRTDGWTRVKLVDDTTGWINSEFIGMVH